jgi:hypothetical protein
MVSGCGGNSGKGTKSQSSATKSSSTKGTGSSTQDSSSPTPAPTATLAQIKGDGGITVTINSATRDTGGFVTVNGTLTNNSKSVFSAIDWRGQEVAAERVGSQQVEVAVHGGERFVQPGHQVRVVRVERGDQRRE